MSILKYYLGILKKKKFVLLNPKGIILSGGPDSVTNSYTPRIPQIVFDLEIPILRYLLWNANLG